MGSPCLAVLGMCLVVQMLPSQTTVDFEGLPESAEVSRRIPGLEFINARVSSSGISLNQTEFPPRSGAKAVFDSGGAVAIVFNPPVTSMGGYFTYRARITLSAYASGGSLVSSVNSAFVSNQAVSGDSGSAPNEFLSLTHAPGILRVVITGDPAGSSFTLDDLSVGAAIGDYMVGDAFPSTTDTVGGFGNDSLDNLDLIAALRAVTDIPGFRPPACTDRYDAIDSFPADGTGRGGNGALDNLDLITTLRRVVRVDTSRPRRVTRGLACPEAPLAYRSEAAGSLILGPAEGRRIPVFIRMRRETDLAGLSFALEWGKGQLRWTPVDDHRPSLVDAGLPGILAVAWLEGLTLEAGSPVLLGYLQTDSQTAVPIRAHGASANSQAGRTLKLEVQTRR